MSQILEPELLQTFIAIVDSGSFTRAARRVCRTQSAVSMQMKRLEEVVGRPLFDRAGYKVLLTPDPRIHTLKSFTGDPRCRWCRFG